ncbi:MAG: hypothetical protein OXF95_04325 [Rhodobacteraceae bacterium]|nr:hypothetical protein [Paracoccaceae bacterium]
MSGWIFAGSIHGLISSQVFPGLLFVEFRQGRGNRMAADQAIQPGRSCNFVVFLQNHTSNIALSPLLETTRRTVVDFNPHHPDLPVGLNREWWT